MELRDAAKTAKLSWSTIDLGALWETTVDVGPTGQIARGMRIAAWQAEAATWYAQTLFGQSHTGSQAMREWLSPWLLHPLSIRSADWATFWPHTSPAAMPRSVIRWGVEKLQMVRRLSGSAPFDQQVAAYLADVDVLVSADKVLVQVADRLRKSLSACANLAIGAGIQVPGGSQAIPATEKVLLGARSA